MIAIDNKEAPTVAKHIFEAWICKFGTPLEFVLQFSSWLLNNCKTIPSGEILQTKLCSNLKSSWHTKLLILSHKNLFVTFYNPVDCIIVNFMVYLVEYFGFLLIPIKKSFRNKIEKM